MLSQLKILFIDDHEGLRDGMGAYLSQKNPVLKFVYASSKKDAIDVLNCNPDIKNIILDINLNNENGLELIPELRKIIPDLKVLVYTMYSDVFHIEMALKANIQGYITKDAKIDELSKALFTINEGGIYYNKRASQLMHSMIYKGTAILDDDFSQSISLINNYKTLTKKEQEIFMLLAQGNSTLQIAESLRKAEKTVINQRSTIYSKMNLKDRLDLLNAARILGVIV